MFILAKGRPMKKPLSVLEQYFALDALIIHSLDMCLYQASVRVNAGDKTEILLCDERGKLLKTHSLLQMQKLCSQLPVRQQLLRQYSAYDEMVGGPAKTDNRLEVPLTDHQLY